MSTLRPTSYFLAALTALLAATGCGSNSPASPTSTGTAVSSVLLAASSIGVGGTTQGTVTLAATPTVATSVTLTSSNAAVATVASPVTVQAGASTVTFTVTGVAPGTASISASAGGAATQSSILTVARIALASISLSAPSVVGGGSLTGTAVLTAPAPAGGAAVALSANDPVSVPATVTVPGGASSASFTVTTRLVGGTVNGTVTGTYGGGTASAAVSITKPTVATANFGVTGPTETDTCTMSNGGNTLNCTFNGSTSTAPGNIVGYDWSFRVGAMAPLTQTTTGAILAQPTVRCDWLPPAPLPAGSQQWLPLTVTLKVRDDLGNVSAEAINNDARVFPQGVCGY
ncbi:MAG: hypothetical protein JWL71_4813 [Acidobacteria bacterium]|nr:hypothetical protein [Acidobacteriota bacterium]